MSIPGLEANANISANQFEAVKMTGTTSKFRVSAIAANTDRPIGILQNNPNAAGQAAEVEKPGEVCKARYGGNVNAGDLLGPDADGELVALTVITDGSAVDRYACAQALEDGADQEVHYVLAISPWLAAKA